MQLQRLHHSCRPAGSLCRDAHAGSDYGGHDVPLLSRGRTARRRRHAAGGRVPDRGRQPSADEGFPHERTGRHVAGGRDDSIGLGGVLVHSRSGAPLFPHGHTRRAQPVVCPAGKRPSASLAAAHQGKGAAGLRRVGHTAQGQQTLCLPPVDGPDGAAAEEERHRGTRGHWPRRGDADAHRPHGQHRQPEPLLAWRREGGQDWRCRRTGVQPRALPAPRRGSPGHRPKLRSHGRGYGQLPAGPVLRGTLPRLLRLGESGRPHHRRDGVALLGTLQPLRREEGAERGLAS